MRLSKRELEAVLSLRHNADFRVVVEAIARETEAHMQMLVKKDLDPSEMLRLQGMTRMGTRLLEAVAEAESAYATMTQPRT